MATEGGERRDHRRVHRCQHLARGAVEWKEARTGEEPEVIGVADDPLQTMLGEDDRETEVLVEPGEGGQHVLGAPGIELARRLVERQDGWLQRQCGGDRDPLAFAARQGGDIAPPQRRDAEQVQHLLDPLAHRRGSHAELLHAEGELVLYPVGDELRLRVLEHEPDRPAQGAGPVAARVEPADGDPPAEASTGEVGHQPVQTPQQRRLAAARRPGEDDERPVRHRPLDARECRLGLRRIAVGHPLEGHPGIGRDGRHRSSPVLRRGRWSPLAATALG